VIKIVKNDLEKLQKKLVELTHRWLKITEYGKSSEPCIHIGLNNENIWFAEIYSYQMDFEDGGRHHYFYADTYEELIQILWEAIRKEEQILIEAEKEK